MRVLLVLTLFAVTLSACSGARYADAPPLAFADLDYGVQTYTVDVGPRVAYTDTGGDGHVMLLVHGLASNAGFWRNVIPRFAADGYRVVAVDLPGFGKSEKSAAFPYTMRFQAETVATLIERLDLGPVTYVGHSMGGQIGITLALGRPDLIREMVLVSPAGIEPFEPGESAWLANALSVNGIVNASEDAVRRNLAMNVTEWKSDYEWLVEERVRMAKSPEMRQFAYAVTQSIRGMLDGPTSDRLGEIRVPTHIVYGAADGLIPNPYLHPGTARAVFQRGAAAIPGATLTEVPGAGHLIQVERPEAFVDAVRAVLRR